MQCLPCLLLLWGGARAVSVDPDMQRDPLQDAPLRPEEGEALFVFPSMQMARSSMDVEVNYRGEPRQLELPESKERPPPPREQPRSSGATEPRRSTVQELTQRLGLPPGLALLPGDGSWMFNSIESTAKQGLAPTHVPAHAPSHDMEPASSERVIGVPTPRPGMRARQVMGRRGQRKGQRRKRPPHRAEQRPTHSPEQRQDKATIPPQYKEVLRKSEDYNTWLRLKREFLRDNKMLFNRGNDLEAPSLREAEKIPSTSSSLDAAKFPHFPDSAGPSEDVARPQRETLDSHKQQGAPAVYEVDGTLYRKPTRRPQHASTTVQPGRVHHTSSWPHIAKKKRPQPTVSSLSLPSHGRPKPRYPSPTYQSPTPSHAPPLPPGYELVPIDQLTEDHEVVPWEELPSLMEKHNINLKNLPLGPYPSSTPFPPSYSPSPFTPRLPTSPSLLSFSPTTPRHLYSSSTPKYPHTYSTKAPFTAFSPTAQSIHRYTPTPTTRYSAPPRYGPPRPYGLPPPFSPDIDTHQASVHSHVSGYRPPVPSTTQPPPSPPKPKSIHFGTHFANVPKKTQHKSTVSTYRYNPTTMSSILSRNPSLIQHSTTHSTTLGRYSPGPKFYTTAAPYFESTRVPVTIRQQPRFPSSPRPAHYPSTTVPTTPAYKPHTTPAPHANLHYLGTKSPSVQSLPPPMPSVLPPPNNPLPTYFDVAKPVKPVPPPIQQNPPSQPHSNPSAPVTIFPNVPRSKPTPPTTPSPPIRLRGTLRPQTQTSLTTAAVAVFMPEQAVPSPHLPSFPSQSPQVQEDPRSQPPSFIAPQPDPRVVAIATQRPDLLQTANPNRHRSSTEGEKDQKKQPRLTPRPRPDGRTHPQTMNFHPISPAHQASPGGPAQVPRLPQARPNVPESENQHLAKFRPRERPDLVATRAPPTPGPPPNDRVRVLTNDNNGIFFLEETLGGDGQFKRNFVPESKLPVTEKPLIASVVTTNTVNPVFTERPRTWPSSLKKSTKPVVLERSKSGQLDPDQENGNRVESTTFSTSKVHVSSSTTAAPRSLEQMMRIMEQKMLQENAAVAERNQKIAKGQKLLAAIREKVAAREQMMNSEDVIVTNRGESTNSLDLQSASSDVKTRQQDNKKEGQRKGEGLDSKKMARLRSRRKKLSQRAKALAKALGDISEEEPYIVFPMDDMNTKEKSVDEIFNKNPGLKRISAYDFEAAMDDKEEMATESNLPIAELKVSIDDLADTMDKLSNTVHETTTKKAAEQKTESAKISKLQEEIAKLTRTLANLQIHPAAPPSPAPTSQSTRRSDSLDSVKTWQNAEQGPAKKHELEIVEVFTLPSTTTTRERPRVRTTFRPRAPTLAPTPTTTRDQPRVWTTLRSRAPTLAPLTLASVSTTHKSFEDLLLQNSVDGQLEVSTKKHPTNRDDISSFFGSPAEEQYGQETSGGSRLAPSDRNQDQDNLDSPPSSILGLFEKMRRMHQQESKPSFEVVELQSQEQAELRFKDMQKQLKIRQMERVRADEEDLREQQRRKLELMGLLQEQDTREQEQEARLQEARLKETKRQMLEEQRLRQSNSFRDDQKTEDNSGLAVASITIENVDSSRDYEVSDNGIVRLRKPEVQTDSRPGGSGEYEYEYYEADPDDIKFPVGGTKQFYQGQTEESRDAISGLSNKDLLMNLLQASNNFQNREFLDRLKSIVTGVEEDEYEVVSGPGPPNPTMDTGHWSISSPQSKAPLRLANNVNSQPIWPANDAFLPPGDQFAPLASNVRFPNRRVDEGDGRRGEVSLVTGDERRKATSLNSFGMEPVARDSPYSSYNSGSGQTSSSGYKSGYRSSSAISSPVSGYSSGHSRIADRLDTTSDQEFLVSTSLAMQSSGKALPPSNLGQGRVTVLDRLPGSRPAKQSHYSSFGSSGYSSDSSSKSGFSSGYNSGTATPVLQGAEVFRLGSGVQVHQPAAKAPAGGSNYILPTYSSNKYGLGAGQHRGGEVYSDIRVEASKKNLLTLPNDPNKMYIKSAAASPEAEVILYPAGQLLASSRPRATRDPMVMSGSRDAEAVVAVDPPLYRLTPAQQQLLDRDTELFDPQAGESPPSGLLETILRSAKDDLKFGSQVINFLQANGR